MTPKMKQTVAFASGSILTALLVGLGGCQEINTRNDPAFVAAADRFANQTVGPEYLRYIEADASLGPIGDATPARESRRSNLRTFRDAVNQAKAETAATGG